MKRAPPDAEPAPAPKLVAVAAAAATGSLSTRPLATAARGSRLVRAVGGIAPEPPPSSRVAPKSATPSTAAGATRPALAPAARSTPVPNPPALSSPACRDQAPLPAALSQLLKYFDALEHTLPLLQMRTQPAVYGLLRRPVERSTQRAFPPATLATVLAVWPEAFRVTVSAVGNTEERKRLTATSAAQTHDWLLEPVAMATACGAPSEATNSTAATDAAPTPAAAASANGGGGPSREAAAGGGLPKGGGAMVLLRPGAERDARRAEYVRRLHALVGAHKQRCLERLAASPADGAATTPATSQAPSTDPDPSRAGAGSAGGQLEECPEPSPVELPPLPKAQPKSTPISRAGTEGGRPRGQGTTITAGVADPADTQGAQGALPAALPPGCEGLPEALLKKVLQRQAEEERKCVEAPTLHRAALATRLPQLAIALRGCMQSAGRRVMGQEELVSKLLLNSRWVTTAQELREGQRMIAALCPQWLTLCSMGEPAEAVVKIDDHASFSHVLEELKRAAASERASERPGAT